MPNLDDIQGQQELLIQHRRRLQVYLMRYASLGEANVTPEVVNGIYDARADIKRTKNNLREWEILVVDHPDDEDKLSTTQNLPSKSQNTIPKSKKSQIKIDKRITISIFNYISVLIKFCGVLITDYLLLELTWILLNNDIKQYPIAISAFNFTKIGILLLSTIGAIIYINFMIIKQVSLENQFKD